MEKLTELPPVARRIHLDCKKCETGRYHVVLAHTSSTSAKVECEVCKSKKTYKLPSATKKASLTRKPRASGKATSNANKFLELKQTHGAQPTTPYKMTLKFTINQVIDHPKFGLGFVTGVTGPSVTVFFEEGERSLVHGRG